MDKTVLFVHNNLPKNNLYFQYQYDECYRCIYNADILSPNSNISINLLSNMIVSLIVGFNKTDTLCKYDLNVKSGTKYYYKIQNREMINKINCTIMIDGSNSYDYLLPLYILLIVLCFCGAMYYTLLMMYRHRILQKFGSKIFLYKIDLMEDFGRPGTISSIVSDDDYDSNVVRKMKSSFDRRLKGLDCFRGISVVLMIFVNYGGGGYWFFKHSTWNGLTVADLVFPWFVFVMGVTLAICMSKTINNYNSACYWLKTWLWGCRRAVVLFIIGVALESSRCKGDLQNLRFLGPLQRLAGAYFCLLTMICIVSPLQTRLTDEHSLLDEQELLNTSTDINSTNNKSCFRRLRSVLSDLWFCLPYIVTCCVLLLAHGCISLLLRIPDCPVGYLGPGGIGDNGLYRNCTGGVAGYIDRVVMTSDHMYQTPTCQTLYKTVEVFDPEGLLGYLTCSALCFMGFWAGNVMLRNNNWSVAMLRLIIYAVICTAIGVGLCQGRTNGGLIPINKNLWSVSYVLISAGTSFFLLAFMFTTVDVLKLWNGSPFRYPGMNPIVIYCGHVILETTFPIQWLVPRTFSAQMAMNVWGAVFWCGISYLMFRKKLFIAV